MEPDLTERMAFDLQELMKKQEVHARFGSEAQFLKDRKRFFRKVLYRLIDYLDNKV